MDKHSSLPEIHITLRSLYTKVHLTKTFSSESKRWEVQQTYLKMVMRIKMAPTSEEAAPIWSHWESLQLTPKVCQKSIHKQKYQRDHPWILKCHQRQSCPRACQSFRLRAARKARICFSRKMCRKSISSMRSYKSQSACEKTFWAKMSNFKRNSIIIIIIIRIVKFFSKL